KTIVFLQRSWSSFLFQYYLLGLFFHDISKKIPETGIIGCREPGLVQPEPASHLYLITLLRDQVFELPLVAVETHPGRFWQLVHRITLRYVHRENIVLV